MNASLTHPTYPGAANPGVNLDGAKPLWAAIGILSVCVLALGASLVHVTKRPTEPVANALIPSLSSAQAMAAPAALSENAAQLPAAKTAVAPTAAKAPVPATKTPRTSAEPTVVAQSSTLAPVAAPVPVQAVCTTCGVVEAVTPVVRDGKAGPVGAIAGGVLGAVLGNQVGKGDGRVLGTVVGAAGGAWAGNTIEKKMNKQTVYAVRVRMEDGSLRNMEQTRAPVVGAKVTVEGNSLRNAEGTVYNSPSPAAAARPAPVQTSTQDIYRGS